MSLIERGVLGGVAIGLIGAALGCGKVVSGDAGGSHLPCNRDRDCPRGDLLCVYVRAAEGLKTTVPEQIDRDRELVEELNGTFHEVIGSDVARAVTSCQKTDVVSSTMSAAAARPSRAAAFFSSAAACTAAATRPPV